MTRSHMSRLYKQGGVAWNFTERLVKGGQHTLAGTRLHPALLLHTCRHLYTNVHSMGNKKEELEIFDLIMVTEIWLDESHDWDTAVDGYKLFLRNRGRGPCSLPKWIDCTDLSLKTSNAQVRNLLVKIRDKDNKGNLVVGI